MSASATTRFFAVAFSVLMLVSAAGVGVIGSTGVAQAQTGGDVIERVNAGGPSVSASSGPDWTADGSGSTYSTGGSTYTATSLSAGDITNPTDAPSEAFLTERYGDHSWSFDVSSGTKYEVRLYFAEVYHGVNTASADTGDRVFDTSIEGQQVLNDYDIAAETGGAATATVETFEVTPTDGTLDVSFTTEVDNAKVSAIEVVEAAPEPGVLDGPDNVNFGTVVTGESATETVTLSNEGESGDQSITVDGASVTGTDAGDFSTDFSGSVTLAPGETTDVSVMFSPSDTETKSASLEVSHDAENTTSPLTVDLSGEGVSDVPVGFSKSTLQGFSAGNPTAIDIGPDGRAYVSTQSGMVYALDAERTGEDSYQVNNEVAIGAIKDIPNHDDFGNVESESNRQITGLTVGGTADQPVVYVGSSDPEIDVGQDDDDTDTNSGAISRLTIDPGSDGTLQASEVTHDVLVLGLPRSEENHATNGLDLTPDGDTLYVAQGGHTNKGAPGDNFGHTPEYALSAAVLEIDLAQIESENQPKSLQSENSAYPDLDYFYSIPTIQGGDLPFGGNDGINQAKLVEGGPVQIYSPGYRNPYDLVLAESGQLYVSDHGPNGGWGGQPADADGNTVADAASVTNHPNEDGSFSTNDQLIAANEGEYAGHAAPIRANPTQADIYDADGNVVFDINESNSPVPSSMVNPVEADYIPPTSGSPDPGAPAGSANTMETTSGQKVLFGPTGGTTEYTASNFGGAMEGDILQVELGGDVERVELSADGQTATNVETIFNTGGPLGITAQDDDEAFEGTVWTANHGGNDVTVFEPNDFGDGGGDGDQCTGADDPSLDEDEDGYDNADEIDAGTDPCSSSSTPADFDDDGESNLNDPDDDNDGLNDSVDPFAVDPDNGVTTSLPVQHDLSELSLFGDNGQGWTGVMTNGQDDYQDLYDPTKMTIGGAAEVLTVEEVPEGDAYQTPNDQQYAFQFGVNPPEEPFTVETTVASFPDNPENYQSAGIQIGPGDQSNYVKLVAAADGGNGGIEFAKEVDDSFTHPTSPNVVSDSAVAGGTTTLRMTVDPTTDPDTSNSVDEVAVTAEYVVDGNTTEVGTGAMPASWLDTSDGSGLAVGVISTSNGASSTFSATWTDISVDYVDAPENQPPTADAGADQTVDEGSQVTLDASGSDDPDGDQLGYTWTQTAGPDVSPSQNDGETLTFTAPDVDSETELTFEVSVSDGQASDTDVVNVTVQDTGDVTPASTSADVTVTEGGAIGASTFNGGSFSVTNTGEESLSSVQIDLSESAIPDAVFDPNGTAGDATAKGVVIDSESGDGAGVVTTDSGTVFSQPHNGVDDAEGYDVLTLEFTDFEAGETVTFSTDIDPTTIKGASTTGGAGSVSGLELSGSAVTVSSSSATVSNDLYTDGSAGGSQANVSADSSAAPALGVEGVTLGATDFPAHEAATVGDQQQSLTLSGPAGETVNLLTIEASEPPTDGYDVDAYEADNAEAVSNQTVSLDSNGQATVQVTLDETNLNYYQAAVQDGPGSNGAVSQTVALEYESTSVSGNTSADVALTPGGGIEASTYGAGSYQVTNTGETNITTVRVDLNETVLPDMVFDPFNTAGDNVGKEFTLDGGDVTVDNVEYANFHNGENNSAGYDSLIVTLSEFEPGETMSFSIDNDPTSISSTDLGSQAAGPVSGLELAGGTVSVGADEIDTYEATLVGDGSAGGSQATVLNDTDETKPTISVDGVSLSSTTLSDRHTAATVSAADQTVSISGAPANADVTLLRVEGELNLSNVPDPYDIEEYEANKAVDVQYYSATTDDTGAATVDVTLTNSTAEGGLNYFVAAVEEPDGDTGPTSDYAVLELSEGPENTAPTMGSITDKGVSEGESLTVDVPASDADGDALDLSVSGPSFVSADDANGTITIAPGTDTVGTYDVTVTADDGNATASESFAVYVDEPDQDGTVVAAVNAGGSNYTAADGAEYVASANSDVFTGGSTYSVTQDIADTEDDTLYQTELYGGGDGAPNAAVPVENGTYEVTLRFAEIYQGVASTDSPDSDGPTDGTNENDRLFSATVEGEEVLTDYDIYSEVGPLTATDKTYTVEVTDGTLNVDFAVTNDNAKISAIKVESLEDEPIPPIGDFENPPTDPDGDGLYEDVNGDGFVNSGDAQAIFANSQDPVVQNNTAAFDYNGDGFVNSGDAQALFANGLAAGDDDGTEA
ncbi:malectin domain-containing carbohydrate-binding protein [Halorubrum sp. HHNYT27]|uniref:malectin domain-containing carbohydrate-binding protein n=1 Tax=Halorubrum sp. HHNYT27 TaxID=3402275 RepID=UPI003EB7E4BC